MRKVLAILFFVVLLFSSCSKSLETNTGNVLIDNHNTMAKLLFDIHLAEGLESNGHILATEVKHIYTEIFQKHKVSPAEFDSAMNFYTTNHAKHKEVYSIVQAKFERYLQLANKPFFDNYPTENKNIWKHYAEFPKNLYKYTQFYPYYLAPRPEYLDKPLIIKK